MKQIVTLFIFPLFVLTLLIGCTSPDSTPKEKLPKNVILLIGDGMGLSQVSSTYYYGKNKPNFSRFPVIGLHNSSSAKQKVTDSAAGATAFASGIRTYNGAIGKDTNKKDVPNMADRLNRKIPMGLVASSSITHATPACFYAHADYRKEEELIAEQLVDAPVDFFAAGGLMFFNKRSDQKNLYTALEKSGFTMDSVSIDGEDKLDPRKKYGYLLAENGMPSMLNGRGDFLSKASNKAIDYLKGKQEGFFLMVEGSQIDWECHAMNVDGVIAEMNDFNKVLGEVLDFAIQDKETLVIVTADHETGGFSLSPTWKDEKWQYDTITPTFYHGAIDKNTHSGHTATLIPVFAYGPGSEKFSGIYENKEIYHKILELTGW